MSKSELELLTKKYNAVFKLMQDLADAGRMLIDLYECSVEIGEKDPDILTVLNRDDQTEVDLALEKLFRHTKEVDLRYGDPDPEGKKLD